MKKMFYLGFSRCISLHVRRFAASLEPLTLVPTLDPQRYIGRWYEIARFQHTFEKTLLEQLLSMRFVPMGNHSGKFRIRKYT